LLQTEKILDPSRSKKPSKKWSNLEKYLSTNLAIYIAYIFNSDFIWFDGQFDREIDGSSDVE
jgi:hypothetical protein